MLKILHVGLFMHIGSGHQAQLRYEVTAAEALTADGIAWETRTLVPPGVEAPGQKTLPRWATYLELDKLYTWWYIWRRHKQFDVVMMRSISPDPFVAIAAPFIPNLVTIHHAKEVEELVLLTTGLRRSLTMFLEGRLKTWGFRRLRGVAGVTDEITNYEAGRFPRVQFTATFPNGIDIAAVPIASEAMLTPAPVHAIFVASTFYPWHGLDLVFDELGKLDEGVSPIVIHLVGGLDKAQLERCAKFVARGLVVVHGHLTQRQMQDVFAGSHLAIGSLALHRQGLRQASTLKVREYLAAGLPVYSTHSDSGIPRDFPFYFQDREFSVQSVLNFAQAVRDHSRTTIRNAASVHIDKGEIMRTLAEDISSFIDASQPARKIGDAVPIPEKREGA